jgi:hypothetical protein
MDVVFIYQFLIQYLERTVDSGGDEISNSSAHCSPNTKPFREAANLDQRLVTD